LAFLKVIRVPDRQTSHSCCQG